MARKINYADMFTLRKDGRYVATYTDEKGRHHLYDKDPKRLYEKLKAATTPVQIPDFCQVADQWERQHREEITSRTWTNYEPHYKDILTRHKGKQIQEVTAQDIANHLTAAKGRGYSATVVNTIRSIYRMIFDYAIAQDLAQYNPVASIRLPKGLKRGKRTAPNDTQIKAIFANKDKPFGLFPMFLLCTGLRKSEALALTWDDLDFEKKEISVTKSLDYTSGANPKIKPPKTEAGNRIVPILDILMEPLQQARAESSSEYLFPSTPSNRSKKSGGLMTLRGYEGAWLRYCQEAGFVDQEGKPTLTAHNLRHGTATLMFELEVDELSAQKILGHSRIEITREIYTELRTSQKLKSLNKFNEGMKQYSDNKVDNTSDNTT